jgi:hypothetical protein
MPGFVDFTRDMCEITAGNNAFFLINFMKVAYPDGLNQFKSFFKPCPYTVRIFDKINKLSDCQSVCLHFSYFSNQIRKFMA